MDSFTYLLQFPAPLSCLLSLKYIEVQETCVTVYQNVPKPCTKMYQNRVPKCTKSVYQNVPKPCTKMYLVMRNSAKSRKISKVEYSAKNLEN